MENTVSVRDRGSVDQVTEDLVEDLKRSTRLSDAQKAVRIGLVIAYWLEGKSFNPKLRSALVNRPDDDVIERAFKDRNTVYRVIVRLFETSNYHVTIPANWKVRGMDLLRDFPWNLGRTLTLKQLRWVREQGWTIKGV